MKAIVCSEYGPLEALAFADRPEPRPGPGQVGVTVRAAGVNFPDVLLVQGLYQARPALPFVPGVEFCGEIDSLGAGVEGFARGERVMCFSPTFGAFAQRAVVDVRSAIRVPDSMPDADAASLLCAHGTAHHALVQRAALRSGETLVVLGAAGGTGLAAVQIGKALGARVVAACSGPAKLRLAAASGADDLIDYVECDLGAAIKDLTAGRGADVVYDPVGGAAFEACARAMARNGRLLVVGFASGSVPRVPVSLALVKEYAVVGVFWGNFFAREPERFAANMRALFAWYAGGKVRVQIDEQLPLRDTARALGKLVNREVLGKLVLIP